MAIDWDDLRAVARDYCGRAYVPYSHYPVGAAGLADDGRVVAGCNVENASYGVTLCAECGLISGFIAGGGGRLLALTCCDKAGQVITPCGRCRQLLWEHGGPGLLLDTPDGVQSLDQMLPAAFGPESLGGVA